MIRSISSLRKLQAASLVVSAMVFAPAHAIVTFGGVPTDTLTSFSADWSWDGAGGALLYNGTHWNMLAAIVPGVVDYSFFTLYQHLDGPHAETIETWHVLSGIRGFFPIATFSTGPEDHFGAAQSSSSQHIAGHFTSVGIGGFSAAGGGMSIEVQHVPEPAIAALMLSGMGLIAALSVYRRRLKGNGSCAELKPQYAVSSQT